MAVQAQLTQLQQISSTLKLPAFLQNDLEQIILKQQQGACGQIDFSNMTLKDYGVETHNIIVDRENGQEGQLVLGYISMYSGGTLLFGGLVGLGISYTVAGKAPPYLCDEVVTAKSLISGLLSLYQKIYSSLSACSGLSTDISLTWTNVAISNLTCGLNNLTFDISSVTKQTMDGYKSQLVTFGYPAGLLSYIVVVNNPISVGKVKVDCDGELEIDPDITIKVIHTPAELQACSQQQQSFQEE